MKKTIYTIGLMLLAVSCGPATVKNGGETKEKQSAKKEKKAKLSLKKKEKETPHAKLHQEKWDELSHPKFWKEVMETPWETIVLNDAHTREILAKVPRSEWNKMSGSKKKALKAELRKEHGLSPNATIYATDGKKGSFPVEEMVPHIEKATEIFEEVGTDPFYAQAILLIETPGKVRQSNVGAHGAFQLMPNVARSQGLKVNGKVDERLDFDKCATAAATFIGNTVVPETKRVLDQVGLEYDENDTWFRLMVMHSYHAGPGNVKKVLKKINPEKGGQELIEQMWTTTAGGFQNASQNYSQLALAALLRFDDHIVKTGQTADWAQV